MNSKFTVRQTAEALGYSDEYVRQLLRSDLLAGEKRGRHWLISQEEVERMANTDAKLSRARAFASCVKDSALDEAVKTVISRVYRLTDAQVRRVMEEA